MNGNKAKKYFLFFIVLAALYLCNRFLLNNIVQRSIFAVFERPGVFLSEKLAGLGSYQRAFFGRSDIIGENERLRVENSELLGRMAEFEAAERENISLRSQLNIEAKKKRFLLLAKIISVDRDALSSTLVINRGANNGVKPGMAVISGGDVMAGAVSEVFPGQAKIILADDPRSSISVIIGNADVIGSAKGGREPGKILLDFVTNKDPVQEGDLIVTSGLDNLPESLLVGRVEDAELKGGSLFKSVEAALIYDLTLGSDLFVIVE